MEFNATIDLIVKDLDDARAIIDDLKRYPGVPEIQVELAKAKCRNASEIISLLKKNEKEQSLPEKTTTNTELEKTVTHTEQDSAASVIETMKTEVIKEEIREVIPDSGTGFIPSAQSEIEEVTIITRKSTESAILADTFSHLSGSLNERLSHGKEEEDISERIKLKHVTSLAEAIGINDKFLFVREIFGGKKENYDKALARLEHANSPEEAKSIIREYTGNEKITGAEKQLLDIVKRKFHKHE